MDEAAAAVRLQRMQTTDEATDQAKEIKTLDEKLEQAIRHQDLEEASRLKQKLKEALTRYEKHQKRQEKSRKKGQPEVTAEDIAKVISTWTKVPVSRLTEKESERLLKLESILHKRVIGQEEAVSSVARAMRRGRVGLQDRDDRSVRFCSSAPPVSERQSFPRRWQKRCLVQKTR